MSLHFVAGSYINPFIVTKVLMSPPFTPKKILLVEDEQSVLFALKLLLEALGFTVKDFISAPDAIDFLATEEADSMELCICDLRMPKMNGLQVLEEMKKKKPSLPFVLMSAHASELEIQKARMLGADGFLSKPFAPDDLQALISSLFPAGSPSGVSDN